MQYDPKLPMISAILVLIYLMKMTNPSRCGVLLISKSGKVLCYHYLCIVVCHFATSVDPDLSGKAKKFMGRSAYQKCSNQSLAFCPKDFKLHNHRRILRTV